VLDELDRDALLTLLAFVTVYFLVAFCIYAASDFVARREAIQAARERDVARKTLQRYGIGVIEEPPPSAVDNPSDAAPYITTTPLARAAPRLVAAIRLVFEFILPVLVGLFAIYVLLARVLGWVSIFPPGSS
jgi:hypothetical protein